MTYIVFYAGNRTQIFSSLNLLRRLSLLPVTASRADTGRLSLDLNASSFSLGQYTALYIPPPDRMLRYRRNPITQVNARQK